MKSLSKNKNSYKKILILSVCAIIIVLLLVGYTTGYINRLFNPSKNSSSSIDYNKATDEQKQTGIDIKQSENSTASGTNKSSKNTTPVQQEDTSKETDGKHQTDITVTVQNHPDNLIVRATVGVIEVDGVCTLSVIKDGKLLVEKTSHTVSQSSYSACWDFTIQKTEIQPGKITIKVDYSGKSFIGNASREVET